MNDSQNGQNINTHMEEPNFAVVECQHCKAKLKVQQPRCYFHNGLETSAIIVPHEAALVCPECRAVYNTEINVKLTKVVFDLRCVVKPESHVLTLDQLRGKIVPQ